MDSFFRPINAPGTRSLQKWIQNYAADRSTFASRYRWAQAKLVEAQQLVEIGALPHQILVATTAQMIVELEDRLCFMTRQCPEAVTELLKSVFILHDTNGVPANEAASLILSRRSPHQTIWASESDDAQRDRLVVFLKCQTFYDQHSLYDAKLQYELGLRPSLEVRMQARAKERQMEARMFSSISRRWNKGSLAKIFYLWAKAVSDDAKRHKMGKFFLYMFSTKPSHIFEAWKNYAREARLENHKELHRTAKERLDKLKEKLRRVQGNNKDLKQRETKLKQSVASLREQLEAALRILHEPARQPPALHANIKGLSKVVEKNRKTMCDQLGFNAIDVQQKGPEAMRLAPLYRWKGLKTAGDDVLNSRFSKKKNPSWDELEAESDYDEAENETIKKWVPGQFPSTEKTPAFKPYDTRPGHRVRRWANNMLRVAWLTLKPPPAMIEPLRLVTDSEDMTDGYKYAALVQYLKGKEEDPDFPGDNGAWLKGLPTGRPEEVQVFRQTVVRTALEQFQELKKPGGRYLTVENVTGVKEEPSEEEKE